MTRISDAQVAEYIQSLSTMQELDTLAGLIARRRLQLASDTTHTPVETEEAAMDRVAKRARRAEAESATESAAAAEERPAERPPEPFHVDIYKLLRQTHSNLGITKQAIGILDSFAEDAIRRLCTSSAGAVNGQPITVTSELMETNTRLIMPDRLA